VPGIVGLVGEDASRRLEQIQSYLKHRGSQPKASQLGPSGAVVVLDDGMPRSNAEWDEWQLAAHARDYSGSWGGRSGEQVADKLLRHLRANDSHAFDQWNGHYAFAAWDGNREHLLLGRDRLGCFPLFYTVSRAGTIAFASEYKALLAVPGADPIVDLEMVQHLQYTKSLPANKTLLKNIHPVEPGSIVRLNLSGEIVDKRSKAPFRTEVRLGNLEEAKASTLSSLMTAVERRTGGSGPIGIALSGGIDSIAVAAICRKLYPDREIQTFTAGYGADDMEVTIAERVSKLIRSRHVLVETPPEMLRTGMVELVWHLEDPIARSETLQLLALGREAGQRVSLLLSAQGADGLFGGMPRHRLIRFMELLPPLRSAFQQVYDFTQSGARPHHLLAVGAAAYLGRKVPRAPNIIGSKYKLSPTDWPASTENVLNRMLSSWFKSNPKFERTFAASGLDYTSPFYDTDLIELAYTIDSRFKITMTSEKFVLRQAVRGLIPDELVQVPKKPQRMRYDEQFSDTLKTICNDLLSKNSIADRGWFIQSEIDNLSQRRSGRPFPAERAMRLWTAILTEEWAREFVDKRAFEGNA